ncbi:hypothetical protein MACK_003543 [Theileria orientalis]|uniref:Uncharacterized protein n=1 Tax=Theileria orientalis TaxID=68886 RepID=A0A976XJC2_THEOR|nr:hypothetical protein MACK_003543 [Theileria orientalis]
MAFYGSKRRRHHHQRQTQDPRPNIEFKFDEELYKLNYAASEKLRSKILSEFSLESHEIPPSVYKKTSKLEVVSQTSKPRAFSTPRCFYCSLKHNFANSVISSSNSATLILDSLKNCILEHQLLLVSNAHVQNTLYLDDNAYTEFRNYQKTLVHMFQQVSRCVIFVETSMNDKSFKDSNHDQDIRRFKLNTYEDDYFESSGTNQSDGSTHQTKGMGDNDRYNVRDGGNDKYRVKHRHGNDRYQSGFQPTNHCKIECYPIPLDYFEEARLYFTKALDEMGPSWSQNKKMTITGKTGVRGSIPQGFDYIHVDFSLSGEGVAYVIEDPSKLRYTFARNIVASILNMDQLERAFRNSDDYNHGLNNIRKLYRDFDWTVSS